MAKIPFKDVKVLVTGATGFIGRHLINALLKEGANVSIICRKNTELDQNVNAYTGDLTNLDFVHKVVKEILPQKIFHLAALVNPSRNMDLLEEILKVNFYGTVNLLTSLKKIDYDSFVFSSTAEVYGDNDIPFQENMPLKPLSPYSLSKSSAEMFCNMLSKSYGYPIKTLRLSLAYGPGQKADRFIPQLVTTLLKNKQFMMTKGEQKRDFIYVEDVIKALIKTSLNRKAKGETINICSGKQYPIKEIANKVSDMLHAKNLIKKNLIYRTNEQWEYCGDITKAKKILNWEPSTDIDNGLKKTIKWYKNN